jgi:hypothetical protein
MSLMHLLSVGQSLKEGKDQPSPYKMRDANRLPKFDRNGRAARPTVEQPVRQQSFLVDLAERRQREAAAASSDTPAPAVIVPAAAPAPVRRPQSFLGRLKPWGKRPPAKDSLVQSELLLDAVKVVRNDLTESDFELVPLNPPEPAGKAAPPSARARAGWWQRLSTRLPFRRNRA